MHIKTSCLTFITAVLYTTAAIAQTNELIGKIALSNGNTMTYKLLFSDSAGIVKGYSISDPGPNQTKAVIKGRIDRDKRSFSFVETKVLNVKDKSVDYCLLKGRCKITEKKGIQLFRGKVTGFTNGDASKPCGKGTIMFSTASDILKLAQKLVADIDTSKLNEQQKMAIDSFKKAAANTSLTNVDEKNGAAFKWRTDTLRIEMYDDGEVDYDRTSILLDDKKILDNYTVTKERHELNVPLAEGHHIIKFHAESEGNTPPNTTKFILWDGGNRHIIATNLYYGQDATIEIDK